MWKNAVLRTLRIALGTAVGLPLVLYLLQEKLLFFPQPISGEELDRIRGEFPGVEEIALSAADGTPLHGWLLRPPGAERTPLVIYFGGNAEEVSYMLQHRPQLGASWALLLMNYRGFGLSGGKPGEAEMFADALRIFDAMQARPDIDAQRITVFGRSLGSGIAVYLASRRPVRNVVLVTPYDSVTRVGERRYPYVPVRLLIKHPFDSLSRAGSMPQPVLILAAEYDEVIPAHHARRLFDAWAGPKRWRQLPGADHNSISDHPDYWPLIAGFLQNSG